MNDIINEITAISNTLEQLNIQPSVYNMDRLLGCQQHLLNIKEQLQKMAEKEGDNANADFE